MQIVIVALVATMTMKLTNKATIALTLLGSMIAATSQADTGTFTFSGVNGTASQVFTTSNGFSLTASGLQSSTMLDQTLSSVNLVASGYALKNAQNEGLGTGPYSDGELRNGAGTPKLNGATIIELSNITGPNSAQIQSLNFVIGSVDRKTSEGYLIYGSNTDAYNNGGMATLTLLDHGYSDSADLGHYSVTGSQLAQYSTFYLTADNNHYSSVLLGNNTSVQAAPEPATLAIFGLIAAGAIVLKRK